MKLIELKEICESHGFSLTDRQLEQFDIYAKFLKEYNQKINLTAIEEYEDVIEKHFYDSIMPLFHHDIDGRLADVGAGAGFPSIPMKIVKPSLDVTIIEPLAKRCKFLNELKEKLGMDHLQICNERAEDFVKIHRESFDYVTARAVANLNVLSELCIPLVKMDGYFVVMKGQQGMVEYENAKKAIKILGCDLSATFEDQLLDGSERVTILLQKKRKCPVIYPRNYGQIKKKPL